MERTVILCVLMMAWWIKAGAVRLAGGDVSLLPEYEEAGANYYDPEGRPIASLLPWLHDEGMNAMRVRLFVNPSDYTGPDADPNACQTMEYILPLCRQICDAGMELMLDFHYSDTWADPARQFTPAAWGTMDDEALARQVYDYTRRSLLTLKEEGIVPAYIQPGNEISYGMLWGAPGTPDELLKKTLMGSDANWDRLGLLLRHAVSACREVCPDAGIVIHTERTASPDEQRNFYRQMERLGIDFDIIGLSYYPYFHGPLSSLDAAITELETDFPAKRIMVVETGYAYAGKCRARPVRSTILIRRRGRRNSHPVLWRCSNSIRPSTDFSGGGLNTMPAAPCSPAGTTLHSSTVVTAGPPLRCA